MPEAGYLEAMSGSKIDGCGITVNLDWLIEITTVAEMAVYPGFWPTGDLGRGPALNG